MASRDKLAAARAWVHTAPETDAAYDAAPARPSGSGNDDTARAWLSLIPEDAAPTGAPRYPDNPAMSTAQNWLALTEPPPPPKSDAGAFERGIYGGYNTLISIFGGAASIHGRCHQRRVHPGVGPRHRARLRRAGGRMVR